MTTADTFQGRVSTVNGRIVQVALDRPGPVPLFARLAGDGGATAVSVAQPSERELRCVAPPPSRVPSSGERLAGDGAMWRKDLDDATVHEVVTALGAGAGGMVLETGIKAIDFLCPLRGDGTLGIFGGLAVGATVLMGELLQLLRGGWQGLHVVYAVRAADLAQARALRAQAVEEGLGAWDRTGKVEITWLPAAAATDPTYVAGAATSCFHAALQLSPGHTVRGLYPAVDGFHTRSTLLATEAVGSEHLGVWQRFQGALARARDLVSDPVFWELVAVRARSAGARFQSFEAAQLARLGDADRLAVTRVRKVERYLTQPFHIAAPFTGMAGQSVPRAETVRTVAAILDGRFDHVPDQALMFKGSISP